MMWLATLVGCILIGMGSAYYRVPTPLAIMAGMAWGAAAFDIFS